MKFKLVTLASLVFLSSSSLLQGCAGETQTTTDTPPSTANATTNGDSGTLTFHVNGEDFVRQGFTTKDGWNVTFDNLYVHLTDVTAYQTDPPYDAYSGSKPDAKETVLLVESLSVDLAEGDESAEPLLVSEVQAPVGQYNALSWTMKPAEEGPAQGYALVIIGQAEKDDKAIDFTIKFDETLAFTCGEFVGDERKGILEAQGTADLEATFHFDHLFGDGSAPPDDEINTGALGFDPLAVLAENNRVEVDLTTLSEQLSPEDYEILKTLLPGLGHVGEGHCHESMMAHQEE
ncbi:MAG: DUF4382 domain-containing protein [Cyanobacteria bacterium SID2]|nr:DUF4382 domain-containing protein [Cyanobacteria bacterium SID2]MBP0002970.1 DUF4382 domain-containing protein [Cyanobacteria bacterium SBC]